MAFKGYENKFDSQFEHVDPPGTLYLWYIYFSCCFDNSYMAVGTEDLPIDKELSLGLRKRILVDKLSNYKLFQDNCFLLF